jgi:hypothetical protein
MQPESLQPPLSNLPSECRTPSPSPLKKLSPFDSFSLSSIPNAFNSRTKESSLLVLILLDEESVRVKGGRGLQLRLRPEVADAKYDGLKDRLAMVMGMFSMIRSRIRPSTFSFHFLLVMPDGKEVLCVLKGSELCSPCS